MVEQTNNSFTNDKLIFSPSSSSSCRILCIAADLTLSSLCIIWKGRERTRIRAKRKKFDFDRKVKFRSETEEDAGDEHSNGTDNGRWFKAMLQDNFNRCHDKSNT